MVHRLTIDRSRPMLHEFFFNFTHNLFKPLRLFFYIKFAIYLLKVPGA